MTKKKIFFIMLTLMLLASLGAISASDMDNTQDTQQDTAIQTTSTSSDNSIMEDTTPKQAKTINKEVQKNTKQATSTSVTNYEELFNNLTSTTADEDTTITLDGDEDTYTLTQPITLSESIKNLVIEGNGKTINGNEQQFLTIEHDCNLKINNLTITNCNSTDSLSPMGSAITASAGNITLTTITFTENQAIDGGAIYAENEVALTITDSYFNSNSASHGGAICLMTTGNITLKKNLFVFNYAENGGAVYYDVDTGSNFEISDSEFIHNGGQSPYEECWEGGTLYLKSPSNITLNHNTFSYSNSSGYGGAVYIETDGSIVFNNSVFSYNRGADGAAIYVRTTGVNGKIIIDKTRFDSNGRSFGGTYCGGAIYFEESGNATINNSKFLNNNACNGTVYLYNTEDFNTLFTIENTVFEKNGYVGGYDHCENSGLAAETNSAIAVINSTFKSNIGSNGGALQLLANNLTIQDSKFIGNGISLTQEEWGGAINYTANMNDSSVNITNSLFDSNTGLHGVALSLSKLTGEQYTSEGLMPILITPAHVSITNTNFTKNILSGDFHELWHDHGILINSINTELYINNSNFLDNGFPENIKAEDLGEAGSGRLIYQYNSSFTIDNSKFVNNRAMGEQGGIIEYQNVIRNYTTRPTSYYSNGILIINNTLFEDNHIIPYGGEEQIYSIGTIIHVDGNGRIDNTKFINNKLLLLFDTRYTVQDLKGVIGGSFEFDNQYNHYELTTNVTNSVFFDNNPSNFIILDNGIVLNQTEDYYDGPEIMFDNYIPNYGDVTIYLDESEEGTPYKLVCEYSGEVDYYGNPVISKVYVDGFTVNPENYLIKMVVNQTEQSQYYAQQYYHNNTYYFILPHDYILSVNTTSTVKIGDTNTIKGKLYYVNSTGSEITFINRPINLYINDSYIATTNTDENGEYEFSYPCNIIGTQNVTVAFNETQYMPKIVNTTTFDVTERESVLSVIATNNTFGEITRITFNLTDAGGNPIKDTFIYFYVDDQYANGTTNNDGIYEYECKIPTTGDNYVIAFFDGSYGYKKVVNSTLFKIYKLNTSLTVTAPNTYVNNETYKITINVKEIVEDEAINLPCNITLIINGESRNVELTTGEKTIDYVPNIVGNNTIVAYFAGNTTHNSSMNKTNFNVSKRITDIDATQDASIKDNVTITYNVDDVTVSETPITDGTITILDEEGNIIKSATFNKETNTIALTDLTPGEHKLTIVYNGNGTYNQSSQELTVKQLPKANITIKVLNNTEGNVTIEYTITNGTDPITDSVTITLPDGSTTTKTPTSEGKIVIVDTTIIPGDYTTNATVTTTNEYIGTTSSKDVTVIPEVIEPLATEISIVAHNTYVNNESYVFKVSVKELNSGSSTLLPCNITLVINGESRRVELISGEETIEYVPRVVGDNTIVAYFAGNSTHNSSMNKETFEVYKRNTQIKPEQNTGIKDNVTITYNVDDVTVSETPVTNGTITIFDEEGNIIKSAVFNQETNTIALTDLTPGEHKLTIVYNGNSTYNQSSQELTVKQLPKVNITIKVLNNTEGNVTIEYTITNGTDPITDSVTITLPNGSTTTKTPTSEGKIIITDTTTTPGDYTTTLTLPSTDEYVGTSTTQDIKIQPDYQKIINELKETIQDMNNTIKDLNDTVQEQKQTIEDMNETIKDLNDTVQEQKQTIADMNKTIKDLNDTVREQKQTIEDMNKTIKDLNDTVQEQKQTIADMNKTIKDLNDTVREQKQTIKDMNETIKEQKNTIEKQNKAIKDLENKVKDLNKTVQEQKDTIDKQKDTIDKLEDTIDKWNKTSTMKVVPENGTVDNNNVIVTLENKLSDPIVNAPVKVVNSEGETIGTAKTNKEGIAVIPVSTKAGTEKVTVIYAGDKKHTPINKTVSITTVKNNVTLTVDPVEGIIGENIKLTAHIKDTNGKAVSGGNLVFKLNGKTLRTDGSFNSTAPAWKFKVNNGKVTVTIKADLYLRNAKNLTASYSGTYKYEEAKSDTVTAQIKKRNAQLTVTATPTKQKQYKTITFTATVKDTTPNTKNTTAINQDTYVIFKVNGKTIKDDNDKNLKVKVKNGKATYKYTVPQGMGGIDNEGQTRYYDVSSVLVSETFYPDTRNDTYFTVERSPVTINIGKVSVNSKNMLSVRASIKDYKNNKVIGTNQINIKINGKSYVNPKTNKPQNFQATNGTVNLKNIQLSKDITVKKITIVTGARQAYLGQRNETTNIVKA